jgi:sugar (glycoside-pentoside-hexuronide) transporter
MRPLKQGEIFGYTVGDLGMNLNFQMISFFLAFFYTDVFGISPVHVAGLFLTARIWDAINDPIMGYLADHTRSRWGRFRPYLLIGALPLNLIMLSCFFTPDLSSTAKVVYAYVTYIAHGMLYTVVGLPYSSISAVMTQDQQERSVISTYRMFFAVIVAQSIVNIGARPFIHLFETEQQGHFMLALIFAVSSTLLLWYSFGRSSERIAIPREKYHLQDIIPIILKNDALLVLALAMFFNTCVWVMGFSAALYYFKYIIGDTNLHSVFFLYMLPANLIGVILAPFMTKKFGKRNTFIIGSALFTVFMGARDVLPPTMLTVIIGTSMVGYFGQMFCAITQWGMLPDTVEYGHWKTGFRSEGIPFAFFSFTQKAGMAIAGSLAALVMSLTGYEANTELTETARAGIEWLFSMIPAGFSLLCLVTLLFYKLDGRKFKQIMIDLENRSAL